ncbi:hypothetical protein BD309DRAFT_963875 [Dichomitus squalens]|nr:hypothetical protein BD309DRAFT_963875 [Dichomitus squalens]
MTLRLLLATCVDTHADPALPPPGCISGLSGPRFDAELEQGADAIKSPPFWHAQFTRARGRPGPHERTRGRSELCVGSEYFNHSSRALPRRREEPGQGTKYPRPFACTSSLAN